jgi:hypothetical protein
MITQKLKDFVKQKKCTLLCAGPMSKNFVDTCIEYTSKKNFPFMLIASRRQIDAEEFGGGYVNNWSTESFSKYVRKKSKKIILCRDHGGPYQGTYTSNKESLIKEEMKNAKISFKADIDNNFEIIHLDPSLNLGKNSFKKSIDRLFELYDYCWSYAKKTNKKIAFEIGTEEQNGSTNSPEELELTLELTKKFCQKNKIEMPTFVVVQSGTLVKEMTNVGTFDLPFRIENQLPAEISIPQMIKICDKYKVMMKAHNCDYLSNTALQYHPRLGIHAVNIAPEFGVIESKSFSQIMKNNNLTNLSDRFLDLSYKSNKWNKWMKRNSLATKKEKSLISGHYIFSTKEFQYIYSEAKNFLQKKKIDLNKLIKRDLSKSLDRYVKNLGIEK